MRPQPAQATQRFIPGFGLVVPFGHLGRLVVFAAMNWLGTCNLMPADDEDDDEG